VTKQPRPAYDGAGVVSLQATRAGGRMDVQPTPEPGGKGFVCLGSVWQSHWGPAIVCRRSAGCAGEKSFQARRNPQQKLQGALPRSACAGSGGGSHRPSCISSAPIGRSLRVFGREPMPPKRGRNAERCSTAHAPPRVTGQASALPRSDHPGGRWSTAPLDRATGSAGPNAEPGSLPPEPLTHTPRLVTDVGAPLLCPRRGWG